MKERPVDLTIFKKIQDELIAANDKAWNKYDYRYNHLVRDYKPEEIEKIINSGDAAA